MRKLVVSEFISLDGVVENPAWTMPYWADDIAAFKGEEQMAAELLLLGRVTYEGFAAAWPNSTDEGAAEMNAMPKWVASNTLSSATWNAHIIAGDVPTFVQSLKDGDGGDILVYGSPRLVQSLIPHGLIDELRLLVYPVVLGAGARLFVEGLAHPFGLLATRPFSTGAVLLTYGPA